MGAHAGEPSESSSESEAGEPSLEERLWGVGLSRREAQMTLLAARGRRVREVAGQLGVKESTVKTLLARARAKVGCDASRDLGPALVRIGIDASDLSIIKLDSPRD